MTTANRSDRRLKASIVVPHRDQPEELARCVSALCQQTVVNDVEIIVVDDGSAEPDTRERLADIPTDVVTVIIADPGGPAHARNIGAGASQGNLLLFTDADCVPSPEWAAAIIGHFHSEPQCMVTTGPLIDITTPHRFNRLHVFFHAISGPDARPQHFEYAGREMLGLIGANLAVRRRVFEEVHGFDTHFEVPGGEDYDLAFRLQASGHRADFVDAATVSHFYPAGVRRLVRRWVGYGAGKARFAHVHGVDPSMLHLLGADDFGGLVRASTRLVRTARGHFGTHLPRGVRLPASAYLAEACFQWGAYRARTGRSESGYS